MKANLEAQRTTRPFLYTRCAPETAPAPDTGTIRIATFNVHYAKRPEAVAEAINSNPNIAQADILLLQEIEHHSHEEGPRAETIARLAGFDSLYAPARSAGKNGTHGLAILSRKPLQDIELVPLAYYNLMFRSRERIGIACKIKAGEHMLSVYNIHLDTRLNSRERIEQLRPVIEDAMRLHSDKVVLAGDFNTLPLKWARSVIPYWFDDQRNAFHGFLSARGFCRAGERGYTMKSGPLRFELDSIYTKGLAISASGVEYGVTCSDHRPLWADITLESPSR